MQLKATLFHTTSVCLQSSLPLHYTLVPAEHRRSPQKRFSAAEAPGTSRPA